MLIPKPTPGTYPVFLDNYISKVNSVEDILDYLKTQCEELIDLIKDVSEAQAEKPYAEGKWSLKELLVHMLDTERIMGFRALCFSRGEAASIPGFEEDDYVRNSEANSQKLPDILEAYKIQRQSTLLLFRSFSEKMLQKSGKANNNVYTVNSIVWMTAGHEKHHLNIMKERYLQFA